ncbi:MAG: hypothetical protein IKK81_07075 [Prevotella sp.]|nr:hypothetical protein [Prevotella sp.]
MKKFLVMIAMMLPLAGMAQEEKDTTVAIPQVERTLLMAADLSKYGYANNDALSLIQAARLSKQAGFVCVDCVKETMSRIETTNEGTKSGKISLDPTKLLGDAKKIAGNDGVLLALIDDVNTNVRGAVGGEKYASSSVNAGATDVYNISFRGGELAMVVVIGDGDTDLDLYVYDSYGNLIARDADYTDNCVVTWTPRWTGKFRIKIVNRGRVYNSYVLRTN